MIVFGAVTRKNVRGRACDRAGARLPASCLRRIDGDRGVAGRRKSKIRLMLARREMAVKTVAAGSRSRKMSEGRHLDAGREVHTRRRQIRAARFDQRSGARSSPHGRRAILGAQLGGVWRAGFLVEVAIGRG